MKAVAWMGLVLTLLVGGDGIYMLATHYKPDDVNQFHLSDGGTVVVAAVILLIVTVIAFVTASRSSGSNRSADVRQLNGLKENR